MGGGTGGEGAGGEGAGNGVVGKKSLCNERGALHGTDCLLSRHKSKSEQVNMLCHHMTGT